MVAIVNARASTNRVDLAGYIIALHTLTSKPVGFAKCLREGVCHRALIIDSFHKNSL